MELDRCIYGDCRSVLRELEEGSAQCCVTSPPYWGLRDYGTATWEGGEAGCDHTPKAKSRSVRPSNGLTGGKSTVDAGTVQRDCHCGAVRIDSQIGLEATPEEYVSTLVEVFREVRRILCDDGTLWLNLGDSYASNAGGYDETGSRGATSNGRIGAGTMSAVVKNRRRVPASGLKPKDLVGIPWRVAFALQADGWYLRSDIIWAKPNPMPESVTDRPTKAHEYVFLLSKSGRYFYDAGAVREPHKQASLSRYEYGLKVKENPNAIKGSLQDRLQNGLGNCDRMGDYVRPEGRNARTVWTIASRPYSGAHYAVMPPRLAARCILAGSRVGDVVLDPFFGSGTTGQEAERLGRHWLGVELNSDFGAQIDQRTAQRGLGI